MSFPRSTALRAGLRREEEFSSAPSAATFLAGDGKSGLGLLRLGFRSPAARQAVLFVAAATILGQRQPQGTLQPS
jgi:hypothetical protein